MNKITMNLYITADDVKIENQKIIPTKGYFYFNGKKYEIENGEIKC